MDEIQELRVLADKLRASQVLGRSDLNLRLFDFLVERTLAGRIPKEAEIAIEVFGRGGDFDSANDAAVRVYIHKLRRKLEEFHAGPGRDEALKLTIPKGEYRIVLNAGDKASLPVVEPEVEVAEIVPLLLASAPRVSWWPRVTAGVLGLSLLANVLFLAWPRPAAAERGLAAADSPVWAPLLEDERPILLVLGDYYLFGDTGGENQSGDASDVKRLVREFDINSSDELHQRLEADPRDAGQYVNLDLAYLPIATAYALRDLVPILARDQRRVEVLMASQLKPEMLKSAHVVYIGYLSGLGPLRDFAFAESRFSLGRNYDELIDLQEKRHYLSQTGSSTALKGEAMYSDFAYVTGFTGPSGNRILIVSGTRDVAVMHAAEALSNPARVRELASVLQGDQHDFEALYEVNGINRTNLNGRLVLSAPRDSTAIWTSGSGALAFESE